MTNGADRAKAWRQANPERVKANRKAYYLANRDKILARGKALCSNPSTNPESRQLIKPPTGQGNRLVSRVKLAAFRNHPNRYATIQMERQ